MINTAARRANHGAISSGLWRTSMSSASTSKTTSAVISVGRSQRGCGSSGCCVTQNAVPASVWLPCLHPESQPQEVESTHQNRIHHQGHRCRIQHDEHVLERQRYVPLDHIEPDDDDNGLVQN